MIGMTGISFGAGKPTDVTHRKAVRVFLENVQNPRLYSTVLDLKDKLAKGFDTQFNAKIQREYKHPNLDRVDFSFEETERTARVPEAIAAALNRTGRFVAAVFPPDKPMDPNRFVRAVPTERGNHH